MKIVKEMPKEGPFIVYWRFNGKHRTGTFRFIDDQLYKFNEADAVWEKSWIYFNNQEVTFLIVGE